MLSQSSTSLAVSENSLATAIGIAATVDTSFGSSALTVLVTGLPSNGTILLADGVTPVSVGETLTVQQLTGLKFRPTLNLYGQSSSFASTVSDPAGASVSATAALTIGPTTTPLLATRTSLSVPQNTGATAIGIQAPRDANYAASALTVKITGLPTNGTVVLSDGTTAKGYQQVSEAKPMEEAERATPHREARQEKSNGGASAAFAIRMEYKGEERSTKLPLDEEMIRQLAMEAEFRGMRIGELVAALILGITRKDLFQLVLSNAPEQSRVR